MNVSANGECGDSTPATTRGQQKKEERTSSTAAPAGETHADKHKHKHKHHHHNNHSNNDGGDDVDKQGNEHEHHHHHHHNHHTHHHHHHHHKDQEHHKAQEHDAFVSAESSPAAAAQEETPAHGVDTNDDDNDDDAEFNPQKLMSAFQKCLQRSGEADSGDDYDDIGVRAYVDAYKQIVKFLAKLGAIFYFVITDVTEKLAILERMLAAQPVEFASVLRTIRHEQAAQLLVRPASLARTSATRTLLRLHRALIFVYQFLDRLFSAEPKSRTAALCTETYEATLGKHHSWLVRKAATLGMHALPRREVLVGYMCHTQDDQDNFPAFIGVVERVYNITQRIYERYDILDLP